MPRTMTLLVLAALAGAALPSSARGAAEWRDAVVEMSDGQTLIGRVRLTRDSILIYNQRQKRRYAVPASEVRKIEMLVEKESMAPKWFFKEDGRDEKVYTGETFPVRLFRARLTFHDGRTLEGHLIGQTFYLEEEGRRRRLRLPRKLEGKVGDQLDEMVYVKSVAFAAEGEGALGSLGGRLLLPQGERLLELAAIHRQNDFMIKASLSGEGRFRFDDCTVGTYDLVAVSDRAIYVFFSIEEEEGARRFGPDTLQEIAGWAAQVRDFFHAQQPLYGAGGLERAYVLVRKERYGGTTLAGTGLIRRYDVWVMHKPADEWQIVKRMFLWRLRSAERNVPRRSIVVHPALGGHQVRKGRADLNLDLDLRRGGETLAPVASGEKTSHGP